MARNLKILMCYPQSYEWGEETGRFIHEAFQRSGHEVNVFDDIRTAETFGLWKMNEKLVKTTEETKPDVLFMLKSESIIPDFLKRIKCKKILWHPDVRQNIQQWVVDKAKECDKFYTMSKGSLQEYKNKGVTHAEYLPEACDPHYHFHTPWASDYFKSKINFIGTVRHDRIDMCKRIMSKYANDFKIWGTLNQLYDTQKIDDATFALLRTKYMKQCLWREYHSYATTDSISITWDWCPEVEQSYSARIYRVMASKGLYLCRYVKGMENVFKRGVHCDWYENLEEMMEKIKFYLENPEKQKEIGENAQKEVYKNHTFDNRIEVINQWLKKTV